MQQTQQPPAKQRHEPVAGRPPRPSRPRQTWQQAEEQEALRRALREMVNAPLPPPEEGRSENLLFLYSTPLSGTQNLDKRAISSISGSPGGRGVVDEPILIHTHPPLSPVSHSCSLRSKVGHISARSCPSGCPCRPVSS